MRTPVTVGVVGLGARGVAAARAFEESPSADLRWICDSNAAALRYFGQRLAGRTTTVFEELLADESLDAVAIYARPSAHADLTLRALESNKHVLVAQPLALDHRVAQRLVTLAGHRRRRLVVSNPIVFDPALRKLKELIELGRLGDVYYVQAIAHAPAASGDGNVLWELGSGVTSTLLHVLEDEPVAVSVHGDGYSHPGAVEVATCWFRFATGITATLDLSHLDPRETRRLVVVGSRRTAVLDERALERRLTTYEQPAPARKHEPPSVGEALSPRLAAGDPHLLECESFVAAVRAVNEVTPARAATVVALIEELAGSVGLDAPRAVPSSPGRLQLVEA